MKPCFSVIIPVLNEAAYIRPLLHSLDVNPTVEVIVVDGGSSDGTLRIAADFPAFKCISSTPGRGIQLNRGAAIASGDVLWFLHADTQIPFGWQQAIREVLNIPGTVAGCFPLRFDNDHWKLRLFSLCSRCNHPLVTYGDQGFFMRREVFESVGGFQNFPILEDLEIQCRLRKLGRWRKTKRFLNTSARRFVARGILRQQLKNICIVSLYLAGVSPYWLARFYRPQSGLQPRPSIHSSSRKPTALNESVKTKGLFTRFPF